MRWIPGARTRDARLQFPMMVLLALVLVGLAVGPALAVHDEVSLPGSEFEIDLDANLVLDDSPGLDWATVDEQRRTDLPTGSGDDSFGQGSKEDTPVPVVVSGSIPPNKSDLKTFGVYQEESASGKFLHLFWTRVQDPSGTTNMDFEFNKSTTLSANGVTPIRTVGDLLVTYDLSKGGTVPILSLRVWTGSAWGPATDLSASLDAAGSINTTAIPAGSSDGLGSLSPRTFGEATIDLDVIFDSNQCESFGSAYLKSRSSDSFTAALKDFIAPVPVNISNCGSVRIEKVDDVGQPLAGAQFTLYTDDGDDLFEPGVDDAVALDPNGVAQTCTTDSTGFCSIDDVLFGDYWIDETQVPANHDKAAGLPAKFTVDGTTTIDLGPYVNVRQRGSILVEKVVTATTTRISGASFALDAGGDPETTDDQTPIPGAGTGVFCIDGLTYGIYTVVETVTPTGFVEETLTQTFEVTTKSDCDDRSETPDLTFENTAQPSIATVATSTTVGGVLSDTATLTGGFNPTGTITFTLYSDAGCTTSVFSDTETVDGNGTYTTDPTYTTTAAGTYYWIASYSGDASNAAVSGACGDPNEASTVDPEDPTISTVATASVTVGGVLSDKATLEGGFNPIGTITFTLYDNDQCSGVPVFTDTEDVTGNGDYTTDPTYTTTAAGTYYWIAAYSGDDNNVPVSGACQDDGETSVVNPATPSLSTVPKLLPNDTATLSGGFGTLSGTLSFELHATADCSGAVLYEEDITVDGAGDYATSNTSEYITADGTYSWLVTYTGDANNAGTISTCDKEQMDIDFTPFE